jgi:hypothetical protein
LLRTQRFPYVGGGPKEIRDQIVQDTLMADFISDPETRTPVRAMTRLSPKDRITITQFMNHPLMRDADNESHFGVTKHASKQIPMGDIALFCH